MYDIILNMYSQIKSKIVYNNEFSPFFFNLKNVVGQVEKFSAFFPHILNFFFNDLHHFINSSHVQSLPTISEMFETKLNVFFKTICHFVRRSQMTCTVLLAELLMTSKNLITSISIAKNKI